MDTETQNYGIRVSAFPSNCKELKEEEKAAQ